MVDVVDLVDHQRLPAVRGHQVGKSHMREFLDDDAPFEWHPGQNDDHYDFGPDEHLPMIFQRDIDSSKSNQASIVQFRMDDKQQFRFQRPFAVKSIVTGPMYRSSNKAQQEIANMRDLRHPHVAALLGSYRYYERLHIVIYPAACCDLGDFMRVISKEYEDIRKIRRRLANASAGPSQLHELERVDTDSPKGSTTSSHRGAPAKSTNPRKAELKRMREIYSQPLKLQRDEKLRRLGKFFVCLCEALKYIHEANLRHKDIKPANILIDLSANVVLTDFGISRRFANGVTHATEDQMKGTPRYYPPENSRNTTRDDRSDIFSLGCVFLEMATLILGHDLQEFKWYRHVDVNGIKVCDYYRALPDVYDWIAMLEAESSGSVASSPINNSTMTKTPHPALKSDMRKALPKIKEMLNDPIKDRPRAAGLWQHFNFSSVEKCRDCHPDLPEEIIWRPSPSQRNAEAIGKIIRHEAVIQQNQQMKTEHRRRLSLQSVPENDPRSKSLSANDAGNPVIETCPTMTRTMSNSNRSPSPHIRISSSKSPPSLVRHTLSNRQPSSQSGLTMRIPQEGPGAHINSSQPPGSPKSTRFAESEEEITDRARMPPPARPSTPRSALARSSLSQVSSPPALRPGGTPPSSPGGDKRHTRTLSQTSSTSAPQETLPAVAETDVHSFETTLVPTAQKPAEAPISTQQASSTAPPVPPIPPIPPDPSASPPQVVIRRATTRSEESATSKSSVEKRKRSSKSESGRARALSASKVKDRLGAIDNPIEVPKIVSVSERAGPETAGDSKLPSAATAEKPKVLPLPDIAAHADIILFDVKGRFVQVCKFHNLRVWVDNHGSDWRCYPLKASATVFDGAENERGLIEASVDLQTLGWWINMRRRWSAELSRIYLVNFTLALATNNQMILRTKS